MSKKFSWSQQLKENPTCADCLTKGPKWVAVPFGVVVCTECSGVHRSIATSSIKGEDEIKPNELEFLARYGNTRANEILEKNLLSAPKPNPKSAYGEKEGFIKLKYEQLAYAPNRTFPRLMAMPSMGSANELDGKKRSSMQIMKQGFLSKRGNSVKSWKRRYFVLVGDALSYFKTPGDQTPIGVIQLLFSNVQSTKDEKSNSFKLITPARTYYFEADSAPEVDNWVETIKDTCLKLGNASNPTTGTTSEVASTSMANLTGGLMQFEEISGYLKKQGNSMRKDWKKRWFILKPDTLNYYKSEKDQKPVGCIHLLSCSVKIANQFGKFCFEIATPNRSYYTIAENAEEMSKWMQGIRNATQLLLASFDSSASVSHAAPAPGQTAKSIAKEVAKGFQKQDSLNSVPLPGSPGHGSTPGPSPIQRTLTQGKDLDLSVAIDKTKKNLKRHSLGSPMHSVQKSPREESEASKASAKSVAQTNPALLGEIQKGKKLRNTADFSRPESLKEGYLLKMGNNLIKDWPKRWCVLKDDCLSYYRSKTDQFPAGSIKLVTCSAKPNEKIRPLCLEIITPNRSYYFSAEDKTELQGWVNAITAACMRVLESFLESQPGKAVHVNANPSPTAPPTAAGTTSNVVTQAGTSSLIIESDSSSEAPKSIGQSQLSGWLNKKGKNVFKEFKRRWCVLREDYMYYHLGEGDTTPLGVINLLLCTVKPMEQKGYYFEVILPTRSFYFQAESAESLYEWVNGIRNASVRLYNELPAIQSSQSAEQGDVGGPAQATEGETGQTPDEDPRGILKAWIADPETDNLVCADCSTPDPRWASINLGIMVCIECSGIHRSLGTHISQVRSVDLDRWATETVQFMMTLGNKKVNQIWEHSIPEDVKKPQPTDPRNIKEEWIQHKYVDKRFANPELVTKEDGSQGKALEKKLPSFFKEGYLTKQGNSVKTWKRRWFVLKVTQKTAFLFYYRARGDPVAAGAIDLVYCIVRPANQARANAFEIISPSRIYICVADSLPEMNSWLQKLREVLERYSKKDDNASEELGGSQKASSILIGSPQ